MIEAMGKTIVQAKQTGRLCYLCRNKHGFFTTFEHRKDWLFRAYPGGRKELSTAGNELLKAEQAERPE